MRHATVIDEQRQAPDESESYLLMTGLIAMNRFQETGGDRYFVNQAWTSFHQSLWFCGLSTQ